MTKKEDIIQSYIDFKEGKFDNEIEEIIRIFNISKTDKDIKDVLKHYVFFEKLIQKNPKLENSEKAKELAKIHSFKIAYTTLAYMRKQERMTKHIIFLTYLMLFSVLAQIIIFLFK